jgi:hypothetical protein
VIYLGLPIGNRVHDHIWSRNSGPTMQSVGSRHDRERLKYKQESTACPQSYPSSGTLSMMSSRNIKYTADTEYALLFGNITDPNKSKQNARVYLQKKVSTHMYIQNKFIEWVKFVPSDGPVIWIRRQLFKTLSQSREPDT